MVHKEISSLLKSIYRRKEHLSMASLAGNKLDGHISNVRKPKSCPLAMRTGDLYRIQRDSRARSPGKDGKLNPAISFHTVLRLHWISTKGIFPIRHVRVRTQEKRCSRNTFEAENKGKSDKWPRRPEELSPNQLWGQVRASATFAAESPEGWELAASSSSVNWCKKDADMGRSGWNCVRACRFKSPPQQRQL